MSTSVLKALPGKLDIKRHSPSILYISASLAMSTSVLNALPGKLDIKRHSPSILYLPGRDANRMREFGENVSQNAKISFPCVPNAKYLKSVTCAQRKKIKSTVLP